MRAGRRHRSALHPLHLRHDRHSERRGARQWRPHGRAEMVDAVSLRHRARRSVVVGLRHRLGGRPLATLSMRRCCTAARRSSTKASRSARPMPARSGASSPSTASVSLFTAPTAFRAIKKEDPKANSSPKYDLSKFRTLFLAGERADPADHRMGGGDAQGAGDRPLVADRNRLVHRRQPGRPRHAAGQARLAAVPMPGYAMRYRRRGSEAGRSREQDRLDRGEAAAAAGAACRRCGSRTSASRKAISRNFPATTKPPTPATRTRTATST